MSVYIYIPDIRPRTITPCFAHIGRIPLGLPIYSYVINSNIIEILIIGNYISLAENNNRNIIIIR